MARCIQCGTNNRDGAVFCQNCGQKMAPATEEPKAKPASGPTCTSCGTVNAPGMNFCKMCGNSLAAPPPAAAEPGRVTCAACGKQTPTGFAFCQHCGQKLAAAPVVTAGKAAVAATMMAEAPILTPPAGMPRPLTTSAAAPAATSPAAPVSPPSGRTSITGQIDGRPAGTGLTTVKTSPAPAPEERVYGSLVVVRRDGSDGDSVRITEPVFDVGRTEGGLCFADDVYLAPRHLRFSFEGPTATVRSLDTVNGAYVRLRGAVELNAGDQFLVGKEVLRFDVIGAEERETPLAEHGVRIFGSVPREAWGRLRQVTGSGTTRDVWHLSRPDLVLGREEGDVTFPDDEFMSRRHAAVRRASPRPKLEDLSSSNGTFLRIRGEVPVKNGDLLRLGDQLLRVEI